jgi:E3 ubiquitin-protein ligase RNF181
VRDMDAPIKTSGKYNLNFIDWNNEWEAIVDRDPNSYKSPIYGMDNETFERIYDEYFQDEQSSSSQHEMIRRLDTKTVNKEKKDNLCAICIVPYRKGEKVFFLSCKHHFHTVCIKPWFQKNSQCPVCRCDIKKAMGLDEDEMD